MPGWLINHADCRCVMCFCLHISLTLWCLLSWRKKMLVVIWFKRNYTRPFSKNIHAVPSVSDIPNTFVTMKNFLSNPNTVSHQVSSAELLRTRCVSKYVMKDEQPREWSISGTICFKVFDTNPTLRMVSFLYFIVLCYTDLCGFGFYLYPFNLLNQFVTLDKCILRLQTHIVDLSVCFLLQRFLFFK